MTPGESKLRFQRAIVAIRAFSVPLHEELVASLTAIAAEAAAKTARAAADNSAFLLIGGARALSDLENTAKSAHADLAGYRNVAG